MPLPQPTASGPIRPPLCQSSVYARNTDAIGILSVLDGLDGGPSVVSGACSCLRRFFKPASVREKRNGGPGHGGTGWALANGRQEAGKRHEKAGRRREEATKRRERGRKEAKKMQKRGRKTHIRNPPFADTPFEVC